MKIPRITRESIFKLFRWKAKIFNCEKNDLPLVSLDNWKKTLIKVIISLSSFILNFIIGTKFRLKENSRNENNSFEMHKISIVLS